MSLVPTYGLCNDRKLYRNPVWCGKGWFICLDDDDPPGQLGVEAARILQLAGFDAELRFGNQRMFNGKFKRACYCFLSVLTPPPPPSELARRMLLRRTPWRQAVTPRARATLDLWS